MSVHRSVRRLQQNLSKLHKAEREVKHDRREIQKDRRELKSDRRELKQDRKKLATHRKELGKDRNALDRIRERRNEVLGGLAEKRAELEQRYLDSFDPADPTSTGDAALQAQLGELDARIAARTGELDARVGERQAEVAKTAALVKRDRKEVVGDRREIKQDRRELKQDRRELKQDRNDVKRFRHNAINTLKNASLHMSIDKTNRIRKSLGLKPIATVGGKVGDWIAKAQMILQRAGVPMSKMDARAIALIIRHESGGNPNAQNNWDSNAANGTPSIGLMQTIGPTFNAYKLPGHGNIRDPIDNIIAGVRYAIARYGSVDNVPGVRAVRNGGNYVGY